MTSRLVALWIHLGMSLRARADAGQGSLEYIGAVLVSAAVVVVVLSSFAGIDVKAVLGGAVKKVTTGK